MKSVAKRVIITEKPSVAREIASALSEQFKNNDGFLESNDSIITWCVGHLVTMSYPEAYDVALKRWTFDTLPFIPDKFKYEVLDRTKKQFNIIKNILHREDIDTIYNAGDSGREGEYIQRLVLQESGYKSGVVLKRIWIDSQTKDEILRGIREAKDMKEYDNLSESAYLRAKEDYLMGINFSRVLTLKYANEIKKRIGVDKLSISVGRVMTCVLGMVVSREREIRDFVKTPFFRIIGSFYKDESVFEAEWKVQKESRYFESPKLYKDSGLNKIEDAQIICDALEKSTFLPVVDNVEKKKEIKKPPLLYNLAELQNDCAKIFKISPSDTLKIAQELYEKKMLTYPRTDARVLSTAVAKEITKNISGLGKYSLLADNVREVLDKGMYKSLAKSRYVNDKQITDHYAIIPTGQGLGALNSSSELARNVYELVARRFLSIFYAPAIYNKITIVIRCKDNEKYCETFNATQKVLVDAGYTSVARLSFAKKKEESVDEENNNNLANILINLKKGMEINKGTYQIKEGESAPPKRYNTGSMILAMENAGQLIEDEELRAQIKGSGIGTSATRAEILKKLDNIGYFSVNKKTQIITPTQIGEMVYEVVAGSITQLLNPALTASWEKGLTMVVGGEITSQEYMIKLDDFVRKRTHYVRNISNTSTISNRFSKVMEIYNAKVSK